MSTYPAAASRSARFADVGARDCWLSFTATGLMGKGTLQVESVRLVKDPVYPYVIDF